MKRLQIIGSTTITLFSNLVFKGVGRHPKTGKKKGGIMAMGRAYIDYEKFEQLTQRGVIYVTKMKKSLKYFYGESANAIKIQIWVTLIANLLLMVMQKGFSRKWSFSGLATMVRITRMYYVDFHSQFNNPERDWLMLLDSASDAPSEPSLFD